MESKNYFRNTTAPLPPGCHSPPLIMYQALCLMQVRIARLPAFRQGKINLSLSFNKIISI
ncbi:MAG: hypothetical protein JNM88_21405 [Chitinophagaceae bacterium]|nr:hypothetical protein [Chitinophagaceae bacterium]